MRITLDYYRILSVPIKANLEQIKRAYEDRIQQQARREYSDWAIASRQQILKQAYTILSNPETKAQYDKSFFADIEIDTTLSVNSATESEQIPVSIEQQITINPHVEIEPKLLSGALIILYELAEYEMILHLGTDYLNQHSEIEQTSYSSISSSNGNTTTLDKIDQKQDILLCLALSYLELSREQWQCQEWEQAAISGQMGLNLLQLEEPLFPSLQAEIKADLDLLKPYRILDLLSHNPGDSASRNKGIQLLKEMLLQKDGIEGKRNAPSGLKLDQFLCFIQQIRTYLTLQEQKEIFLAEAKRGSALGSCVAAYTLVAEGYSQKKPDSIIKAKQIFQKLSPNQDTHWERAICALLLGKTAESQAIIRQNSETETFQLINKRSQYSPDLIPGICFYAEQWLQKEVLSQFKSLSSKDITLHDYFDDPQVQAYLDKISPVDAQERKKHFSDSVSSGKTANSKQEQTKLRQRFPWWGKNKNLNSKSDTATSIHSNTSNTLSKAGVKNYYQPANNFSSSDTDRISHNSTNNHKDIKLPKTEFSRNHIQQKTQPAPISSSVSFQNRTDGKDSFIASTDKVVKNKPSKRKKVSSSKKYSNKLLLLLGIVFGVGALGFVVTRSFLDGDSARLVVESAKPKQPQTPVNSNIDNTDPEPVAVDSTPETDIAVRQPTPATLNPEIARKTIQQWLDSKKAALGQQHQIDALNSILIGDALTQWRNVASYYKQNNIYRQFEHTLKIDSVTIDPNNSEVATVDAAITETAQHYQQGKLNQAQSYNSNLLVRYELTRQNDDWSIKNSKLLENQ